MASIQASRFALLKVDDDFDEDNQSSKNKQNVKNKSQQQAAKKKNKKKKKADQTKAETDDLRNLAFGSGKKRTTSQSGGGGEPVSDKQWQQWRNQDEEFAADEYEKSLQQALLQSRLEFEEHKQVGPGVSNQNGSSDAAGNKKGKKKKKEGKPVPMSLDEFKQMEEQPTSKRLDSDDSEDEQAIPSKPALVTEISQPDTTFFDNVKKDVGKILQKERIQEEYKKQYVAESVISLQYQENLEKLEEQIKQLKKSNKEVKSELKQAKDRNQQLCHILAQGEMKSKAAVLRELEELRRVHEELNQEVSDLTEGLEKERSKVHALTAENTKLKGGKHAK